MAPALPSLGTIINARYTLVEKLGEGAMGTVFLATQAGGKRWALKLLTAESRDADTTDRFLREARVASDLESDHLVQVVDYGVDRDTGWLFLVMPIVQGGDLEALLARVGALPPTVAVRIAIQAAEGLAVAHATGVVHRDIKPSNLMLARDGDRVSVRVTDFGIAKDTKASVQLTRTGTGLGSPLYMSPELFRNARRADPRADVWGLAMVLYEALAGQAALGHITSVAGMIEALAFGRIPPLQERAPWVDPALAAAIHGALLGDLEARCPSMTEFADALRPFAGGDTTLSGDSLHGISDAERAVVAPRATPPTRWPTLPPPAPPAAPAPDPALPVAMAEGREMPEPASPLAPLWIGLGALGLVLAIGAVFLLRAPAPPPKPLVPATPSAPVASVAPVASPAPSAPRTTGVVQITPPDARVTVDGTPRPLGSSGSLLLEGAPGQTFVVDVESHGTHQVTRVVLTNQGSASPSALAAPAPSGLKKR